MKLNTSTANEQTYCDNYQSGVKLYYTLTWKVCCMLQSIKKTTFTICFCSKHGSQNIWHTFNNQGTNDSGKTLK